MDSVFCVSRNEIDSDSSVMVGMGAYASVYKVRIATGLTESPFDDDDDDVYALKKLHSRNCNRDSAAKDLLQEAKLLAELPRHENIVSLQGVSTGFWRMPASGFLLLDYLPTTLESRMEQWRSVAVDPQERVMEVCLPIARALAFLHQNDICYHDLKPQNIGFDSDGTVRLYDFGFARKVNALTKDRVGTPRYMAPEVMKKQAHDTSCDVYSFAVLSWEIITLKKPFEKASDLNELIKMVAEQNERPSLSGIRNKELNDLLRWSWHQNPSQRPSADQLVNDLSRAYKHVLKKQPKASRRSVAPERRNSLTSCAA